MRAVCMLVFMALSLLGQDVEEKMSVTLREVRVHVTDTQGNPIRGLTKDNFVLSEEGASQSLSYFEETDVTQDVALFAKSDGLDANGNPILEGGRRVIVFALDTSDMDKTDFDRVMGDLKGFINELGGQDYVKLVQFDDRGADLTPFTTDKDILLEGLNLARFDGKLKKALRRLEREIAEEMPGFGMSQAMVNKLEELIPQMDGRVRAELSTAKVQAENLRNEYALNIDNVVQQKEMLKARYFRAYYLNMKFLSRMLEPIDGPKQIYFLSGGVYLEGGGFFRDTETMAEDLAADLNQSRVTVYSIFQPTRKPNTAEMIRSAGSSAATNMGRFISDVMGGRRTIRDDDGNILDLSQMLGNLSSTVSILNVERLQHTSSLVAEYTNYTTQIRDAANPIVENTIQMVSGVQQIARDTGGIFIRAKNQSALDALTTIHKASGHYYTLGYNLNAALSKRKNKVKIKLKDVPGKAKLHYGEDIARDQPYQKMDQDEREVAFKAELVFSQVRRSDLKADWNYVMFSGENDSFRLAVTGSIALPESERERGDIGFAALDEKRDPIDFTFTALERFPARDRLEIYDVLICERQPAYLRYMIKNPITGSTTIEEVEVADPGTQIYGTHLSGILLAAGDRQHVLPLNHIRANAAKKEFQDRQAKTKKKKKKDEAALVWEDDPRVVMDPSAIDRHFFRPSTNYTFEKPETVDVFFHFANFEDETPFLDYSMILQSEEGFGIPQFGLVNMNRRDDNTLRYHVRLQTAALGPGVYRLYVKMVDNNYKTEYKRQVVFQIKGDKMQP